MATKFLMCAFGDASIDVRSGRRVYQYMQPYTQETVNQKYLTFICAFLACCCCCLLLFLPSISQLAQIHDCYIFFFILYFFCIHHHTRDARFINAYLCFFFVLKKNILVFDRNAHVKQWWSSSRLKIIPRKAAASSLN